MSVLFESFNLFDESNFSLWIEYTKNSSFIIYQLYMCTNIVNIFVYLGYSNLVVMKKYKL